MTDCTRRGQFDELAAPGASDRGRASVRACHYAPDARVLRRQRQGRVPRTRDVRTASPSPRAPCLRSAFQGPRAPTPPRARLAPRSAAIPPPNDTRPSIPTDRPQVGAAVDTAALNTLRWREIGPFRGGRSVAVAGSAARPNEFWMGTTGGGVFKSIDGGQSWAPVTDKYFGGTIGAIAVARVESRRRVRRRRRVSDPRQRLARRRRVEDHRRRQDVDVAWDSTDTRQIARVVVQSDESRSRVRRRAGPRLGAERRSAASIARRTAARRGTRSSSATTRPASSISSWIRTIPNVLYAAFWQAGRTPWLLVVGRQRAAGSSRRTDGGDHWTEITRNPGLPAGIWGNIGITVSPRELRIASGRSSRPIPAACSAPTTAARRGRARTAIASCASAPGTTRKIHADPKDTNVVYVNNVSLHEVDRRREDVPPGARHAARRLARPVDRAERIRSA